MPHSFACLHYHLIFSTKERETIPDLRRFAWQAGYAAFAVSYSHIETVKRYIATQADHHRNVTFQEEFLAFPRRHDLEFEERYLWN